MSSRHTMPRPGRPGFPVITQTMLADCVRLDHLVAPRAELRRGVLELFAMGATVEPGPLTARPDLRYHRYLSAAKLVEAIGEENAEAILGLVPLTPVRRLLISGGGPPRSYPAYPARCSGRDALLPPE